MKLSLSRGFLNCDEYKAKEVDMVLLLDVAYPPIYIM
jgi:hypothetical protein